jgi:hypothetical protein
MANDDYDPFHFHSGLPEDFDGLIDDAYFMYDPEYNSGQTLLLKLEVKCEDVEVQEMLKRPLQYSVGGGFSPIEGGAAIERDDGAKKGFHQNSAIANLLTAMLADDAGSKAIRGPGRGNPMRAEMYIGTIWHWDRVTFKYGGEIGDKDRLMPNKFIGMKGAVGATTGATTPAKAPGATKAAPAKAAAKKAAAPAQAAQAKREPEPTPEPGTPAVDEGSEAWNQLWDLAMAADDHGKFVEAAFELEGVADDEGVQQIILDDGEGSLWGKAVEEYQRLNG